MQIVINIDDEDYDDITLTGENTINLGVLLGLREAVRNGTPLPKGHGRLGDLDKLKKKIHEYQAVHDSYCDYVSNGDVWEGHTKDHYETSSGKATACEVILKFIDDLIEADGSEEDE